MAENFIPFSYDDEFEDVQFGKNGEIYGKAKKAKKLSKNDQLYGIWNNSDQSESDSEEMETKNRKGLYQEEDDSDIDIDKVLKIAQKQLKQRTEQQEKEKEKVNYQSQRVIGGQKGILNFVKKGTLFDEADQNKVKIKEQQQQQIKQENKKSNNNNNDLLNDLEDDIIDEGMKGTTEQISDQDDIIDEDEQKLTREQRLKKRQIHFQKRKEEHQIYNIPQKFGEKPKKKVHFDTENNQGNIHEFNQEDSKYQQTYGKGFEILKNLGYKPGHGTGKNKQGIVNPLEAIKKTSFVERNIEENTKEKLKKKKQQKINEKQENQEEGEQEEEENVIDKNVIVRRWQRSTNSHYKPNKKHLKVHDVALQENQLLVKPITQQKVIDMRGPTIQVYEDYSAFKTIKNLSDQIILDNTQVNPLDELNYSLKTNFDKIKYSLQVQDRKLKNENNKEIELKYQKDNIIKEIQSTTLKNKNLLKIQEMLLSSTNNNNNQLQDPNVIYQNYKLLFDECQEEFIVKNIVYIYIKQFIKAFENIQWNSLTDQIQYIPLLKSTNEFIHSIYKLKSKIDIDQVLARAESRQSLLNYSLDPSSKNNQECEAALNYIFQTIWLNKIRNYIVQQWDPKQCEELIHFIETYWKDNNTIPEQCLANVYDNLILPKIKQTLEQWSPVSDNIPVHFWLHPWLPILGQDRMQPLWKNIINKLSNALQKWQPTDNSAYYLLKPWKKVLDEETWNNLMMRCIMPKLMFMLRDFEVNPSDQQYIQELLIYLKWKHIVKYDNFIVILENQVLIKIQKTFCEWINKNNANHHEILQWLKGWMLIFGSHDDVVNEYFHKMLDQITSKQN